MTLKTENGKRKGEKESRKQIRMATYQWTLTLGMLETKDPLYDR